jgi:hypothetical protein
VVLLGVVLLQAGPLGWARVVARMAAGLGLGRVHCHHGPLPRPEH